MAPPLWCECATGFTAVKVWCSPSSPCSLRCAWLRVVPLLPSPTLHAVASVSPGRGMKARLAGDVDTLISQRRDDPRRRCLGEARFVGYRDDPGLFGLAQCVRRDRTIGIWPPITPAPYLSCPWISWITGTSGMRR